MLWKRFMRFFAHVRGQCLGRLKKPIIRLHVVHLRQLEVRWKLVWGGANALFSPFKSLKFPVAKDLRGHIVSISWCLLIYIEKLHRNLSCLAFSVGWCWLVGERTVGNVQPVGLAVWDKLHSNSMCSSTRVLIHHVNPSFFSYTNKLVLYRPTFFPSGISLSSSSFRQVLCEWTYDGMHQVVVVDISNHYISRIKRINRKNGCHSFSI